MVTPKIIYRRLSPADLPMVVDMNTSFRPGFMDGQKALQFLEGPSNWLFAAVEDKQIVGFVYGYGLPRLDTKKDMLYIHEVGVLDSHQRRGIGFAMMEALKAACQRADMGRYFLSCYQNNEGANALYKKLGGTLAPESQGMDTNYFFLF